MMSISCCIVSMGKLHNGKKLGGIPDQEFSIKRKVKIQLSTHQIQIYNNHATKKHLKIKNTFYNMSKIIFYAMIL